MTPLYFFFVSESMTSDGIKYFLSYNDIVFMFISLHIPVNSIFSLKFLVTTYITVKRQWAVEDYANVQNTSTDVKLLCLKALKLYFESGLGKELVADHQNNI